MAQQGQIEGLLDGATLHLRVAPTTLHSYMYILYEETDRNGGKSIKLRNKNEAASPGGSTSLFGPRDHSAAVAPTSLGGPHLFLLVWPQARRPTPKKPGAQGGAPPGGLATTPRRKEKERRQIIISRIFVLLDCLTNVRKASVCQCNLK